MKKVIRLYKKKKKLVIGLMSGTSLDGIDAALVEIENSGIKTKFKELFFRSYAYPSALKKLILKNSNVGTARIDEISTLNVLIAKLYARAVFNLCREYGISVEQVDLIGCHGQTIHHLPRKKRMFGQDVTSTLQIGDPSTLAKLTGVVTCGDFRLADMAVGGQGAPLVPYFDYISFRSSRINRALLNIGGISNITLLRKKCSLSEVIAFDTGPGNILIDILVKQFFKRNFDKDGKIAESGKVNQQLFNLILKKDKFLSETPPKSTGREHYNKAFINRILKKINKVSRKDIITTFSEYTAYAVFYSYHKFLRSECEINELLVSGGGALNQYIMESLKNYFGKKVNVRPIDSKEISGKSKEAVCFAVLANETISGNPANIPGVTGAYESTVLGKICY